MTENEAFTLVGREVRNKRTGRKFVVYTIAQGCLYLSGGQIIPFDAFDATWERAQ